MRTVSIAIDGPAASGKSTIGALVAERLGYLYIDTGAMYRAVTWAALEQGVAIADEQAVTALAERLRIDIVSEGPDDGRQYTVLHDGVDITWAYDSRLSMTTSPGCRPTRVRRRVGVSSRRRERGGWVRVGREHRPCLARCAGQDLSSTAAPARVARHRCGRGTARWLQLIARRGDGRAGQTATASD